MWSLAQGLKQCAFGPRCLCAHPTVGHRLFPATVTKGQSPLLPRLMPKHGRHRLTKPCLSINVLRLALIMTQLKSVISRTTSGTPRCLLRSAMHRCTWVCRPPVPFMQTILFPVLP